MKIYGDITELIGETPLVRVSRYCARHGIDADILCKLEYFNPAGSVKDRIALAMVEEAEARGALGSGSVIVEPTSGNTGIGLAAVAAARGYKAVFVMPETMSVERRALLKAYGAEIVLTDGGAGMAGAVERAREIVALNPCAFMPSQFDNPANPAEHERSTGAELWRDTDGKLDAFVAGVGTGGTVSGVGRYLKSKNPNVSVYAVEPEGSPVLSGGKRGTHKIQGIGAGFVPANFDASVCDGILRVSDGDALETARALAADEGIFVGISSGAALFAAGELAKSGGLAGKTVVVVLPDGGARYLSVL